jgi:hypothetical protein
MPVDPQPLSPPATGAGHDDVDDARVAALQAPQRGGGRVAERGARATGEDGRHPAPVHAEHRVPDGVHADVDRVQPPRLDAAADRRGGEPEREQLAPGDHAVLARREHSEVALDESFSDIEKHSSSARHSSDDPAARRT